jgi:hypothetical protein
VAPPHQQPDWSANDCCKKAAFGPWGWPKWADPAPQLLVLEVMMVTMWWVVATMAARVCYPGASAIFKIFVARPGILKKYQLPRLIPRPPCVALAIIQHHEGDDTTNTPKHRHML